MIPSDWVGCIEKNVLSYCKGTIFRRNSQAKSEKLIKSYQIFGSFGRNVYFCMVKICIYDK